MSTSNAADERGRQVVEAWSRAAVAVVRGDLAVASAEIDAAAGFLRDVDPATADQGELSRLRAAHGKLLAALTSEHARLRAEIARVRDGQRAIRSYGARRHHYRG